MKKTNHTLFLSIFIVVVLCLFVSKQVLNISNDTAEYDSLLYNEEFVEEMYKGVQGNFTLEQVDSMQREWARLDSIESAKP